MVKVMSLLVKAGSGREDQCFSSITAQTISAINAPPIGIIGKCVLNVDRYVQFTNRPTAHFYKAKLACGAGSLTGQGAADSDISDDYVTLDDCLLLNYQPCIDYLDLKQLISLGTDCSSDASSCAVEGYTFSVNH